MKVSICQLISLWIVTSDGFLFPFSVGKQNQMIAHFAQSRSPSFSGLRLSRSVLQSKTSDEVAPAVDEQPDLTFSSATSMLGDLSWRRVAGLFAGQSMIGLVGGAIAWAVHGNPLEALGPRYMLWSYRSMGMTFAMGVVATIPLLGYIWLEDALDLSSKFPNTLGAVANATKVTCLLALGSERAPLKAGIAACFLALAAGAGEELLFRGVIQQGLSTYLGRESVGLLLASVIFGALHAVTPTYALLAGIAGMYFGALYNISHTIFVPAIAHALYDAVALMRVHFEVTAGKNEEAKSTREAQVELLTTTMINKRIYRRTEE